MNSRTSIPKKLTITNDKFITSRSRRGTNMHIKEIVKYETKQLNIATEHINPISILRDQTNDDHRDVGDGGNVADATGSVHDGDGDDTDARVHPSHRPTSQMLSPILSTELAIILWQIAVIPSLQYR
ncbi:hypothetical protein QQG55_7350 [Brugia pahangi]